MEKTCGATERNKGPIAEVLRDIFPANGLVLEVASGTGQHALHFGTEFPSIVWQPSDIDDDSFASIRAWCDGVPNVRAPIVLDAASDVWPIDAADAVFNCNMIHISPWSACMGLLAGAGRVLSPDGVLVMYGPYFVEGTSRGEGNIAFDQRLRARNPEWGIRTLGEVEAAANSHGLALESTVAMPANNLTCIYRRQ